MRNVLNMWGGVGWASWAARRVPGPVRWRGGMSRVAAVVPVITRIPSEGHSRIALRPQPYLKQPSARRQPNLPKHVRTVARSDAQRAPRAKGEAVIHADEQPGRDMNTPIVLVLRLALDQGSRLRHGELLDAGASQQGRFTTWQGLLDAVAGWLARQRAIDADGVVAGEER